MEKRQWIAIGQKLEVEGKDAKVDLKKLLSNRRITLREVDISRTESVAVKKIQRALHNFLCLLFPRVNEMRRIQKHLIKKMFVELSLPNTE